MTDRAGTARGLSAAELEAVVAELQPFVGALVLDAVPLVAAGVAGDLVLVLDAPGLPKQFLHIAPGGNRARVTITARRFPKPDCAQGPQRDHVRALLGDARVRAIAAAPGERRCELHFATPAGDRTVAVELFGARGLWALLDAERRVLALSRAVGTAVRTLRQGDPYSPPPPTAAAATDEPAARFAAPLLAAVDAHFTARDLATGAAAELDVLQRACQRTRARAEQRVQGLQKQLADTARTAALRTRADLMLAYAHGVPRGAATMTVPDPQTGEPIAIDLDPARPVVAQAQALYDKARRLDEGRAIAERRCADAERELAAIAAIAPRLATLAPDDPAAPAALAELRAALAELGALPRAAGAPSPKARPKPAPPGENFRRFVSAEGYPILVGRNNEQNDRLTMRVANGNDVWLHVGGGRPGSHVVVRLPKQKTASLETLLDAGTLAVHFSKARGERRVDVVYTLKKHVRKPKGLPAGAVVPAQTKTLVVDLDEGRLRRLLASGGDEGE